jgi:tetratricopeptide (TPR) repeat protein
MSSSKALERYILQNVDETRRARQFERIATQLGRGPSRWRRFALPVVAVSLAALLALVIARRPSAQPEALPANIALLEGGSATLADGSQIMLDPSARVLLAVVTESAIRLELERGRLDVEASHDPGRSFVVAAAGYEVHVVGTRFRVERSGEHGIAVSVERGRVQVRQRGRTEPLHELTQGQTWSSTVRTEQPGSARNPESAPEREPAPPPSPLASASAQKSAANVPSARQLFERAQAARAAGRLDEARAAFSALRRQHPTDPRASIAAFELARIELDAKGDPKQAALALDEAIDKAPAGAPYREDAEARRVEAVEASGDQAKCVALRSAYLARYPRGVHRAQVANRCKKR